MTFCSEAMGKRVVALLADLLVASALPTLTRLAPVSSGKLVGFWHLPLK